MNAHDRAAVRNQRQRWTLIVTRFVRGTVQAAMFEGLTEAQIKERIGIEQIQYGPENIAWEVQS